MKNERLSYANREKIQALLIGRTAVKVANDTITLDNGVTLKFKGNNGGCVCDAGCYDLTALNGVDNVITNVAFVDDPGGEDYPESRGRYKIFVFADNEKINLATFEGTDGNGYYGTGWWVQVSLPE